MLSQDVELARLAHICLTLTEQIRHRDHEIKKRDAEIVKISEERVP